MEEKKFELVTSLLKERRLFDTMNCPNNCLIKKRGEKMISDRTTLMWKSTFFIILIIFMIIIMYH